MCYINYVSVFVVIIRLYSVNDENSCRILQCTIIRVGFPMIKFPKQSSGSRNEILRIGRSLFSLSRVSKPNLLTRSCLERHVSVCACACAHSQVAMRGGPERARDEGRSTSERDVMVREEERVMFTRGRKRKRSREKEI